MARRQLNTLTAARKELSIDDLRFIGQLADFFQIVIDKHPNLVVEDFFGKYMRQSCALVDTGINPGSSTESMLQFYKYQADSLAERIVGPKG